MGYIGLAATTWLPMGGQVPILSPNDHPNPSYGQQKDFMTNSISKNFHASLNNPPSVKTTKSSPARGHRQAGGGATGGTWSWDPGPQPWVRGSIYKKHILQNPGPNTHTTATIRKAVLTRQPPPPPKRDTRVRRGGGGYGGQNPKNHRGIIFGPKRMILQGVRRQKPYIGVCYANDPKKGGYTTLVLALDLTTSLRGNFGSLHTHLVIVKGTRTNR